MAFSSGSFGVVAQVVLASRVVVVGAGGSPSDQIAFRMVCSIATRAFLAAAGRRCRLYLAA